MLIWEIRRQSEMICRLAVSRALGDHEYRKAGVIATPEVEEYKRNDKNQFLILACDGVWDVLGNQAACEIVQQAFKEGKTAEGAAKALVEEAFNQGSTDNISAIVIDLCNPK